MALLRTGASGPATRAVNQVIAGGVAEAGGEALALAEKLNPSPERLLSVLDSGADGWKITGKA